MASQRLLAVGGLLVALLASGAAAAAADIPTTGLRLSLTNSSAVATVTAAAASEMEGASVFEGSVVAASGRPAGKMFANSLWAGILKANRNEPRLKTKLTDFIKIVEITGMKGFLSNPKLYATMFVPDNWAFQDLLCDSGTGKNCDEGDLTPITMRQLVNPKNKALLKELVLSYIVPDVRFYTPMWPKWDKKVWLKTLHPKNRIGLEMDDGGPRPGPDDFDVDGTDDDAELIHKSWKLNLKCGRAVLHLIDDVSTWNGWKNKIRCNVLGHPC